MTGPTTWPSVDIHKPLGPPPPSGMPSAEYFAAFGKFLLESFIGNVALAFGAIDILGWKPFDFLADWGQERIDEANANFIAATTAQAGANYANAQLTGLLVTDAVSGVSLSAQFDGSATTSLAGFTQIYEGSGGTLGIDGNGRTKWNKSGGLTMTCTALHPTPLNTGTYQRARLVIAALPEQAFSGAKPAQYLVLRSNLAADTLVLARIAVDSVELGCLISNVFTSFVVTSHSLSLGDTWDLYAGTPTDDRQFLLKRNGNLITSATDALSAMGAGYEYVGLGATAPSWAFFTTQGDPGQLEAWGAIDRQVTSI